MDVITSPAFNLNVYILSFIIFSVGILSLFILTNSTNKSLYVKIWQELLLIRLPSIRKNLKTVVSDCLIPLLSATKEVLGNVKLRGCWFNNMRILARKWRTFNLNDFNHKIFRYALGIPTLAPNQFKNAIELISVIIDDNKDEYAKYIDRLRSFTKFLELWWQPMAESISFTINTDDSINISEYFDRHLASKMGSLSPDIFQFSERVKQICCKSNEMYLKMEAGYKLELYEKNSFIKMDARILKLVKLLEDGKISLNYYLEHVIDSDMHRLIIKMLEAPQFDGDDGKLHELTNKNSPFSDN